MYYLRDGIISLVFFFLLTAPLAAQYKYEKEFRIEKHEVPAKALSFIDSCFIKNVKWYSEESPEGQYIEAKAKLGNHHYSIEFDTCGHIQDVEKTVKFRSLDRTLRQNIKTQLRTQFTKFTIVKTNVRWTASNPTLQVFVNSENSPIMYKFHYELIVKGRKNGQKRKFEVVFDDLGNIEKIQKMIEPTLLAT